MNEDERLEKRIGIGCFVFTIILFVIAMYSLLKFINGVSI